MSAEKTWKVVAILDEYRLIISAGAGAVSIGDKLEVFERGEEIRDPESGASLGHVSRIKARVVVDQVEEKVAVVISDEYSLVSSPSILDLTESLRSFYTSMSRNVRKGLNIRPEDAQRALLPPGGTPIVKGDLVRKTLGAPR
jgi:hypothetical protein